MNVTAEAVSSTVILVKWDYLKACSQVNDLLVNFTVQYIVESSSGGRTINETRQLIATTTDSQLTGVTPYTNYSIKVAAVDEFGDVGQYSYPVIVQTPEDGRKKLIVVQRYAIFFSTVPGPVGAIMVLSSQSQVSLSWDPPLMPNGIIIAYEVSYQPTASSEPETRVNTTALVTHFTTEDNLEEDTEFFLSVRAYTKVGPGYISSLIIKTGSKSCAFKLFCFSYLAKDIFVSFADPNLIYIIAIVSITTVSCIGMSICGTVTIWTKAKR